METRVEKHQQKALIPDRKRCATQGLLRRYTYGYKPS